MSRPVVVRELTVRREDGDLDTLYLCRDCEKSTETFLTVLSRKPSNARCDRCDHRQCERCEYLNRGEARAAIARARGDK